MHVRKRRPHRVGALLALRVRIEPAVVPVLVVSLVWEAGCSPKLSVDLQQGLGNVAPVEIIRPSSRASYGLSEDEMIWQLDFLRDMG